MKKTIKMPTIIYIILCIFACLIMIYISSYFDNKLINRLNSDYKEITFSDSIKVEIMRTETFKGPAFVTLTNGKKVCIPQSFNENYNPESIDYFLQKGDTILKRKNSDTVYVLRNNKEYLFIIYENIEKK